MYEREREATTSHENSRGGSFPFPLLAATSSTLARSERIWRGGAECSRRGAVQASCYRRVSALSRSIDHRTRPISSDLVMSWTLFWAGWVVIARFFVRLLCSIVRIEDDVCECGKGEMKDDSFESNFCRWKICSCFQFKLIWATWSIRCINCIRSNVNNFYGGIGWFGRDCCRRKIFKSKCLTKMSIRLRSLKSCRSLLLEKNAILYNGKRARLDIYESCELRLIWKVFRPRYANELIIWYLTI